MKQGTFFESEISEKDLMDIAIAQPLDKKISNSIGFLRLHNPPIMCDSGGKDSTAMWKLKQMAGIDTRMIYSNVTIDPPPLIRYLKKERPNTIWVNPKKHLITRMVEKMIIPTRLCRWCCGEYKEKSGEGIDRAVGVRVAESARRKGLWREVIIHNREKVKIYSPILYWTDEDVWEFLKGTNTPYCELYDEGFSRLGCVGCPLGGTNNQLREFARFPRHEALWQTGFKRIFEKKGIAVNRHGNEYTILKHKDWKSAWEWWLQLKTTKEDECQGSFMFGKEY